MQKVRQMARLAGGFSNFLPALWKPNRLGLALLLRGFFSFFKQYPQNVFISTSIDS
jgi:hypothetical protein